MEVYAAFYSDGASVVVSDADLDDAAAPDQPLSAELADAAAQVAALSNDLAVRLLREERCADERTRLLHLLGRLTNHPGDEDIAAGAASLLAVLSAD